MKIIKKISATLLVLSLSIATVLPVYANNHGDTKLPSQYISSTTYVHTELRDKYDDSYHYMYNKCSIEVSVISYSQQDNNCTNHGYALIPANSKRFISNYVYEWGYRNCKLSIRSNISGASTTLSGYWSPDSIGSYIVANP